MKSTGITRRLDDLGRVAIPKELRRTLRLQEGDQMEFLVEGNDIILRKWSMLDPVAPIAQELCDAIGITNNAPCVITDRDHVIAAKGTYDRILGTAVPTNLHKLMEGDTIYQYKKGDTPISFGANDEFAVSVSVPITVDDEAVGAVTIGSYASEPAPKESDLVTAKMAATFLRRYLSGC